MSLEDEYTKEEDFFHNLRRSKKIAKEDILDEIFRKAEISKGLRPKEEKKVVKKPFLKIGIILIIIAVISLTIIYTLPWMYIKCDTGYGTIQEYFNKDFENKEGNDYEEIDYIFESPCTNCSNNSKNYIGLNKNDFTDLPKLSSYGFITLIFLSLIFTIFVILERIRNLSMEIVTLIHSIFAATAIIISIFITFLSVRFFGVYFLLYYNKPFIEASGINNIILIFPVPIILFVISIAIIIISINIITINFHELKNNLNSQIKHSSISTFRYGSKI